MAGRLDGKVAVVTGAGSVGNGWGNGRATAVVFAREGARVLAVDRAPEPLSATLDLIAEEGGTAQGHICDVTDSAAVEAMIAAAIAAFGGVDVMVNNVGGSRHGGPTELDEAGWRAQIELNLTSVYLGCRHAIPAMRARGGGAIVNIASTSGQRFTGSPQVAYASAKAAVIQLSKVTAVEHAPHGIRVNTVVPGQLHTPLVEARLAGQRAGGDVDALLAQRLARIPLGFMGDGRDTAHAALFLASDEARFVTGTEIVVDGGMTARCD
ncbi:SDR family NAD(P)-dependent oxidoreductase [Pseudonocardia sp. MH-G8]|uniref:SDR family NAD(P)-dependent oxidoreductase n=1 Tax=Pseudonocardia sp. MH-G8 TaxID=1854588 RepID=UPI000B9F9B6C|nr:SDR family NAD(P)-dependent oxidoreductase [Pseudonocardia sp. MH-G8]OZM78092.1 3-oxoacyl-ACP reductase [Pseudonocardia sp. MH-G8]